MLRGLGFRLGAIAFCLVAWAGEGVAQTANGRLLATAEIVDLYARNVFCYDYRSASLSCSSIEELADSSPAKLRVVHRYLRRINHTSRDPVEKAFNDAFLGGTIYRPDGYEEVGYQTLTLTPAGLCRTRDQEARDARMMEGFYVYSLKDRYRRGDRIPQASRDRWRDRHAADSESLFGDTYCYQYRLNGRTLQEYEYRDGVLQSGYSEIMLFDKGAQLDLRFE